MTQILKKRMVRTMKKSTWALLISISCILIYVIYRSIGAAPREFYGVYLGEKYKIEKLHGSIQNDKYLDVLVQKNNEIVSGGYDTETGQLIFGEEWNSFFYRQDDHIVTHENGLVTVFDNDGNAISKINLLEENIITDKDIENIDCSLTKSIQYIMIEIRSTKLENVSETIYMFNFVTSQISKLPVENIESIKWADDGSCLMIFSDFNKNVDAYNLLTGDHFDVFDATNADELRFHGQTLYELLSWNKFDSFFFYCVTDAIVYYDFNKNSWEVKTELQYEYPQYGRVKWLTSNEIIYLVNERPSNTFQYIFGPMNKSVVIKMNVENKSVKKFDLGINRVTNFYFSPNGKTVYYNEADYGAKKGRCLKAKL